MEDLDQSESIRLFDSVTPALDPRLHVRLRLEAKSLHPPFGFMALSDWYFEMLRDSARQKDGGSDSLPRAAKCFCLGWSVPFWKVYTVYTQYGVIGCNRVNVCSESSCCDQWTIILVMIINLNHWIRGGGGQTVFPVPAI